MILAVSIVELPAQLGEIFYTIVLPILSLAAIGWLLQRRLGLEMDTLRRLNFYFVMPAMIYYSLLTAEVRVRDVALVVGFTVACLIIQGSITYAAGRLRRLPPDVRRAMMLTTMLHNSGNYGMPLQGLAFSGTSQAGAVGWQTFVMITQNLFTFTIGILIVAGGGGGRRWRENLLHIAKFPPIYALAAALVTLLIRKGLDLAPGVPGSVAPLWEVIKLTRGAFIPVALVTLGAQLALVSREKHGYPVKLSVLLRLLGGPAIALGVVTALRCTVGIAPLAAQVLLISASTPTAVNCMLMCLEFQNHPDYAARAVLYSTLLSPITVTLTILLAQGGVLPGFAP